MNALAQTIDGVQAILVICPCCGEIFRLVEGKLLFPQRAPRRNDFIDLLDLEDRVADAADRVQAAEDRFQERIESERGQHAAAGRARAKERLRKIDPHFSGRDVDPQDAKLVFDPVEYIVFHGLSSASVTSVELVSRAPTNARQESVVDSLAETARRGNVLFETLRIREDGSFAVTRADRQGRLPLG